MSLGDYTRVTYVNESTPAISATNLNNNEAKTKELDTWASAPTADTISEATSGVGVTIDGVLHKDGGTYDDAGYNYASDFTISGFTGSFNAGRIHRNGSFLMGSFRFAGTGTATGNFTLTIPSGLSMSWTYGVIGTAIFYDSSNSVYYYASALISSSTTIIFSQIEQGTNKTWGTTYPVTMESSDQLNIELRIPIYTWI